MKFFLLLFFILPAQAQVGYTLKACENSQRENHVLKFKTTGGLDETCMPDTLYSWGTFERLQWFEKTQKETGLLPIKAGEAHQLYTWRSPIGSFSYGDMAIRIKLKKGTKFRFSNRNLECSSALKPSEYETHVMVRYWQCNNCYNSSVTYTGVDYILCSAGPIESWSYGLTEHYNEMVRELDWMDSHTFKEFDTYLKGNGFDLLFSNELDHKDWTRLHLKKNFEIMRELIQERRGKIYYSKDIKSNPQEHFATQKPIFYNPN